MLEELLTRKEELSEREQDWVTKIDASAGSSERVNLSAKQEQVIRSIYETYASKWHPEAAKTKAKPAVKKVTIYTDGSARKNPGPGGYGTILIHGKLRKELSAGFRRTTNNRMEILAAIVGLEVLKYPCEVTVISDSKYVVNAIEQHWIEGWKRKGWARSKKEKLKNKDLWQRLDEARAPHKLTMKWVKGHSGHAHNERCDYLATTAADKPNQPADQGFEDSEREESTLL